MKKLFIPILLLSIFAVSVNAQTKKPTKPKPEEEETGKPGVVKESPFVKRTTQLRRTKIHQTPPSRLGGMNFSVLSNEFLGFGAKYEMNRNTPLGIAFGLYYFPIPSNQLYFDPYYYQYVQRNKGSMIMLIMGGKYDLPFMKNEPNIVPYTVFGGGGVLGMENDLSQQSSFLHYDSKVGYTTYGGAGVEYRINSWALNFDVRYQLLRFPRIILGKTNFDGLIYNLGIGKLF